MWCTSCIETINHQCTIQTVKNPVIPVVSKMTAQNRLLALLARCLRTGEDSMPSKAGVKTKTNKQPHPELWCTKWPNNFSSYQGVRITTMFHWSCLMHKTRLQNCCFLPYITETENHRVMKTSAASLHQDYLRTASAHIQSSCYSTLCSDNFLVSFTVCYRLHLSLSVSVGGEYD